MTLNDPLCGYTVIENPALTQPEEKTGIRTWRERLLSRPWRPLRATKVVIDQVPSREFYVCNETRRIVMHPAMKAEVMRAIDGRGNQ